MLLLRLIFVAQLLVMLTGFVVFLVTPAGFQTVALLFYLVAMAIVAVLYAAWQFVRHSSRRALASATIATPVVFLTAPFLIVALNKSPIAPGSMVALVIALLVIASVVILLQKDHWRAGHAFATQRFNAGFVIALGVLLVLYWIPIVTWLYFQDSVKLPTNISERDNVLRFGAMYFVTVAGPALILSLFAMLYAPVGLVRNAGKRLAHTGQLILALMTLASLAFGAFAVALSMFNPG